MRTSTEIKMKINNDIASVQNDIDKQWLNCYQRFVLLFHYKNDVKHYRRSRTSLIIKDAYNRLIRRSTFMRNTGAIYPDTAITHNRTSIIESF